MSVIMDFGVSCFASRQGEGAVVPTEARDSHQAEASGSSPAPEHPRTSAAALHQVTLLRGCCFLPLYSSCILTLTSLLVWLHRL